MKKETDFITPSVSETEFFVTAAKELPAIIPRKHIHNYLGGLFKPANMEKMDRNGQGPPSRKIGGAVVYERNSFIEWLKRGR